MINRLLTSAKALGQRQIIGSIVNLSLAFTISYIAGPEEYGVFAAYYSVYSFILISLQLGLDTFTLKSNESERNLAGSGALFYILITCTLICIAIFFLKSSIFSSIARIDSNYSGLVILIALPFHAASIIPLSFLDQDFEFKSTSSIEVRAILLNFCLSIILVLVTNNFMSGIIGFIVQSIYYTFSIFKLSPFKLSSSGRSFILRAASFNLRFGLSSWIWQSKLLIVPFIIIPLLGPAAGGFVNLAARVIDGLSIFRRIGWRMGNALLIKNAGNPDAISKIIKTNSKLQSISNGLVFITVGILSYVLTILPFNPIDENVLYLISILSFSAIFNSIFIYHSLIFYVRGENLKLLISNFINLLLVVLVTLYLSPKIGVLAYAIGEALACASYAVLLYFSRRISKASEISSSLVMTFCFGIACLVPILGIWMVIFAFIPFIDENLRREAKELARNIKSQQFGN